MTDKKDKPGQHAKGSKDMTHVQGTRIDRTRLSSTTRELPRTKPVKSDLETIKSTMPEPRKDTDEEPLLNPEEIRIDYDKLDTSDLFEDECKEKEISTKMLSPTQRQGAVIRNKNVVCEPPPDISLTKKELLALSDIDDREVENSKGVSYRTKGSYIKKHGAELVIAGTMAFVILLIMALWWFGYLDF